MRGHRTLAQQACNRPACGRSEIELPPETLGLQAFGAWNGLRSTCSAGSAVPRSVLVRAVCT
eukprot:14817510-Alexandrium_andersonii.AAC.1